MEYFSSFPALKGFRHIVQAEPNGFMLNINFQNGIRALEKFSDTYDILIHHHQLDEATAFLKNFHDQLFVADHLAKACGCKERIHSMEERYYGHWQLARMSIAKSQAWLLKHDWLVCLLAASYTLVVELVNHFINHFSKTNNKVLGTERYSIL